VVLARVWARETAFTRDVRNAARADVERRYKGVVFDILVDNASNKTGRNFDPETEVAVGSELDDCSARTSAWWGGPACVVL